MSNPPLIDVGRKLGELVEEIHRAEDPKALFEVATQLGDLCRCLLTRWRETNENLTRIQTAESANLIAAREARDHWKERFAALEIKRALCCIENEELIAHATVLTFGSHRAVRELGGEIWRIYDGSSSLILSGTLEECRTELKRRGVECP